MLSSPPLRDGDVTADGRRPLRPDASDGEVLAVEFALVLVVVVAVGALALWSLRDGDGDAIRPSSTGAAEQDVSTDGPGTGGDPSATEPAPGTPLAAGDAVPPTGGVGELATPSGELSPLERFLMVGSFLSALTGPGAVPSVDAGDDPFDPGVGSVPSAPATATTSPTTRTSIVRPPSTSVPPTSTTTPVPTTSPPTTSAPPVATTTTPSPPRGGNS